MTTSIQITCPHCHQSLKVAGATAGRQVRCPHCHGFLRVPDQDTAPDQGGRRWLVRTEDGSVYGPVARAELDQWVREGRVHTRCQVSPEGGPWIWASEMYAQLVAPPSHAPPQPRTETTDASSAASPFQTEAFSDRSRLVAGLLGLLLPLVGIWGVHRLYTGHITIGILMLVTCGGCGIWQLIDVILVFAGAVTDVDGLPLRA